MLNFAILMLMISAIIEKDNHKDYSKTKRYNLEDYIDIYGI